ncbi:cell envelope integrity protein CreD [Aerophototrophica crusticola]|uniref:Cell envelope integrity protein CreD n=1 Tax=Aerophototrophica crusticola TaxID=1709002 RepID=A0A858R9J2_9PROT|nr:cell envelope integrity protein CreD [Rhodospirillaceae bacterium B3]
MQSLFNDGPPATPQPRWWHGLAGGSALKLGQVAALTLALMVPLSLVQGLVEERSSRGAEAVAGIAEAWGGDQRIGGPILVVPVEDPDGKIGRMLHVAPATLSVGAALAPEVRYRGIWQALLYTGDIRIRGHYALPDLPSLLVRPEALRLDLAFVQLGLSDPSGLGDTPTVKLGDKAVEVRPGWHRSPQAGGGMPEGLMGLTALTGAQGLEQGLDLEVALSLRGTESLSVHPLGRDTTVAVTAPWPSPSTIGSFLPTGLEVRDDGFAARWSVPFAARDFPADWVVPAGGKLERQFHANAARVGVSLVTRMDHYAGVLRATKYGVLFVALTLLMFFLCEAVGGARVHWVQYGMVGLAVCLFYLLLLSLSEQVAFGLAYAAASAGIVGMVGLYSLSVLRSRRQSLLVVPALTALYALLYVILQAEEQALLLGSLLLFATLGAVMFVTRDIDWHQDVDRKVPADLPA